MTNHTRHIVLIGFMGSGKSTIGRMLAVELGIPFFDMDDEIIRSEGMTINAIFDLKGERYFRDVEQSTLARLLESTERVIISTGGGTPCHNDTMKLIRNRSQSFYLKLGQRRILERLRGSADRPLILDKNDKQLSTYIAKALKSRADKYEMADNVIMAYSSPIKVVRRIIKMINKQI